MKIYRQQHVAAMFGRPVQSLRYWISKGQMPAPTHPLPTGGLNDKGYTLDEINAARKTLADLGLYRREIIVKTFAGAGESEAERYAEAFAAAAKFLRECRAKSPELSTAVEVAKTIVEDGSVELWLRI
jgi:hypothetical protein